MSGLLGVGGGFIMVPLLVLWTRLGQHAANGTSLAAIVPISVAGAAVYYFGSSQPQMDLHLALLLVIGSVVGAYLGARLTSRLPEHALRTAVAVILVVVAAKELVLP